MSGRKLSSSVEKLPRPLLAIILVVAAVLLFRVTHVDMVGDDAHYSVRAIGPVDFMFGDGQFQSTPIQWFDIVPRWAGLSFHDHPKPLFLVQHLFLSINANGFFAKLPSVLFALGTIFVLYHVVKRQEPRAALGATLFLVLNAHFIWAGRVAYLESGVMFCIALCLYYFTQFETNRASWWKFGFAFGLALSVKFTTLFLIPGLLLYVACNNRQLLREAKLYAALGLSVVVLLPVIFYNLLMFEATGHFSLQFARLFGQDSPWHLAGVSGFSPFGFVQIFINLAHFISWPFLALALAAIIFTLWSKRRLTLYLSLILFFTIQQFFIGQQGYVLSMYAVLFAPLIALAAVDVRERLIAWHAVRGKNIFLASSIIFGIYLGFFTLNSHVMPRHYGSVGLAKSAAASQNFGVAQLDAYLDKLVEADPELTRFDPYGDIKIKQKNLEPYLLETTLEIMAKNLKQATVIIFDDRINWFSRVWLFERRRFYNNLPVISISEDYLLNQLGIRSFYFIKAEDGAPLDSVTAASTLAADMEKKIIDLNIMPVVIYRDDGEVAFKVYHVTQTP